jgi:hypothetical protein
MLVNSWLVLQKYVLSTWDKQNYAESLSVCSSLLLVIGRIKKTDDIKGVSEQTRRSDWEDLYLKVELLINILHFRNTFWGRFAIVFLRNQYGSCQ